MITITCFTRNKLFEGAKARQFYYRNAARSASGIEMPADRKCTCNITIHMQHITHILMERKRK